ncbi:guanitoxin biosynthesis MBL fold metallo-hydrolase GntH [Mesotoga sp. BH458_6_3_2_1]|uniref:guanitoxin biosynthesis MBL fold metallo-hydrolase GntH n=1 Tax=Mesotoga sp. BH458_6_3_2_1 TaxID=1437446 RepID=UPI000EF1ADE3|nr:guanitoxin biosynthesis MBL fold metallo-hydrolase GntH [Mesotoga sp. BH458_6_3_2_1]RLL83143.1 beta-lactamase [Mesotoga sp. BH458_6_3_2_1]
MLGPIGKSLSRSLILCVLVISSFVFGYATYSGFPGEIVSTFEPFLPGEQLAADQMRITFMGTSVVPRLAQQCNSIFVELGNGDSFVFDFGSGVSSNYVAVGIPPSRMDKVFLTHLHGDHVGDLITLYCFGPSQDRKTPLYLYGPSGDSPEEGTLAFAQNLMELMKWHVEAFSFLSTGLKDGRDGYDIIAKELPYMTVGGVAYEENGVRITHFPAVHDRNGSISYKLEWNGLSMVFSGDTIPNYYMIQQAKGVDVLIHEMVVPPEVWASKNSGLKPGDPGWERAVAFALSVQRNSHTSQKAFGYILRQTNPRLGIATHFQANEDTVGPAIEDIRLLYEGAVAIATDLLVINVSKSEILVRKALVSEYAWYPQPYIYPLDQMAPPKYDGPYAQFNDTLLGIIIPEETYGGEK